MQERFFWLKWDQPFKHLTTLLFVVLTVFIIASIALIFIGPDGLLGWHTFSQKVAVDVIAETIDVGPFSFPIVEQLSVIKEFVSGGEMTSNAFEKQIFLLFVMGGLALVLTLITYFNRFGFILFSTIIFFFIIFLHPEMLKIAEVEDYWILGMIFLLFIGPAYYFQAFRKNASFGLRASILITAVALFLIVVVTTSGLESPLNVLFSYGILAPYLVVLLFTLLVGHEVVAGFAIAIAGSKDDPENKRIMHFLVITFIYLLNVLIAYLQITHVIDWNFITLNPIILLGIAALFGVWGISQRYILYKTVSTSQQVWVLLFLALAIISFVTISYLLLSMEDPLLKIISDFIVFTQLSFGVAFLIYIVYNFSSIIEKGHSIKDIIYQPTNLPHSSSKLVGMLILTAIVFMRDVNYPIWYSLGGYYNSIAGYFEDQEKKEISTAFYEKGADLSKKNHKSNYKLGMTFIDLEPIKAIKYFGQAGERVPTPQAFVNKANLESDQGAYFEALFTLQNGAAQLPNSVEIKNNLGLQFSKANMLDSAWHYFSSAKSFKPAQNNALAFVLENEIIISESDSVYLFSKLDKAGIVNASALGVRPEDISEISGDNMLSASLLINALVNGLIPYSEETYSSIVAIVDSTKHAVFAEELNYSLAIYEYRNEQISKALLRLQKLTSLGSDKKARYFELLGLINLKYESYNEAEKFFMIAQESATNANYSILPQIALAQSEAGYFDDAIVLWKQIKLQSNEEEALKATVMIQVLTSILNNNDSIINNDISFYLKARYQRLWVDEYSVKATFDRIGDKTIKNQLALELATYYFEAGNKGAIKIFYDAIELEENDESLVKLLLYFNIRMAYGGIIPDLDKHLVNYTEQGYTFDNDKKLEETFFNTNRVEISNEFAEKLASQNPYFEEGVVWAAEHFSEDEDVYKSYNILQQALNKNADNRLLLEAYILKAIDIGMDAYAMNSLQHYREIFPGEQFRYFEQKVLEHKANFDDWDEEE